MYCNTLFFKTIRIEKEIVNIDCKNSIFIIIRLNDIFGNNDFLERVVNPSKRSDFLNALWFIWQRICRLDIVSDRSHITNKIKKQQWLFQSLLLRTDVPIVSETHKSSDFINLLKKLNEKYPEGDIIRIVCDNHSAHKSKETRNFLATCPEGRFVLSRIFCMRCDQFLFVIYDDRHCFSPSAPNLFPIKYLCLVRS